MIDVRSLSVQRGGRNLLDDISFSIEPGKFVGILGPNGAGKSTLVKTIGGSITPDSGSVTIDGIEVNEKNRQLLAQRRGVMSQHGSLAFSFTALEVVLLGRTPHRYLPNANRRAIGRDAELQIAMEALERVGAVSYAAQPYPTLSGGERQRIDLARALVQIHEKPAEGNRYLLLDEPTASLDLAHQRQTLELARQAGREGIGILAVLHDLNAAAEFADRIILLGQGKVVADGPPWSVLQPERIESTYGLPMLLCRHPVTGCPILLADDRTDQPAPEPASILAPIELG